MKEFTLYPLFNADIWNLRFKSKLREIEKLKLDVKANSDSILIGSLISENAALPIPES